MMGSFIRWLHAKLHNDRAATGVEYALLIAVFASVGIGASKYLTDNANRQVSNQADCVSTRPPPPSCQVRALSGTTTTTNPATTTTTTTTPPPPAAATWNVTKTAVGGYPTVNISVTLRSGTNPVPGATIQFNITYYAPGLSAPGYRTQPATCVTNASGVCTVSFQSPFNDTTKMVTTMVSVDSNPAFDGSFPPPNTQTWP